jgi:pSer/pThr/pTyr-binding forkhead associated (FHA) protein
LVIHLHCACGAELRVAEVYAGGQVHCHACGATVLVPADMGADEKFRFHCPHCEARVVARRSSAGKKSQCPACEQIYVVPEPPSESVAIAPKESRRIELSTDDLALRIGMPFPVGKLETPIVAPPQARFLHSSFEEPNGPQQVEPQSYAVPQMRGSDDLTTTALERRHDGTIRYAHPEPRPAGPLAPPPPMVTRQIEAPPPSDRPRTREPVAPSESSSAPTAAAIPQMTAPAKPASVGELQILSGNCSGQRIRLDFRRFVIGVERDCDLRPASPLLSRHHCVFKKDEYSLRIRDLGSTNGTFVNGRRIFSEAILKPGDEVTIGDVTFHVYLPRAPQVVHSMPDSVPSISDFVIL